MSTTYVRIGETQNVVSATNPLPVTIAGSGATDITKAEDAAHASGDHGVMLLAVRKDSAAALAGTDLDYIPLTTDSTGRLRIAALAANSGVDIGDVDVTSIAAGDNNIGNVDIASIAAGETLVGLVGSPDTYLTLTPTIDTSAYTSGDVLFTDTELTSVGRTSGGNVVLQSLSVIDVDDEGVAIDLYFFDRDITFGAINGAPSPSDADALFFMGHVSVATGDYKDLGGFKVASLKGIGLQMKPNATSLWVAGVVTGTPTFTAATDLKFGFGFLRS